MRRGVLAYRGFVDVGQSGSDSTERDNKAEDDRHLDFLVHQAGIVAGFRCVSMGGRLFFASDGWSSTLAGTWKSTQRSKNRGCRKESGVDKRGITCCPESGPGA